MARRPVDEKIIKLKMDNRDLASKAAESTTLLTKLRDSLNKIPGVNLGKTTSELGRLGEGVKGVDMNALAAGVDTVSSRFSNMGLIGMTVVQDLTRRVVDAGIRMGKSLIAPIVEGGKQRALNIEQAKFQFQGLGMDVEASMASANEAVLGTAFGLDEAAMAAAMFGASGMTAGDEMTSALRAISGVAAMTGSSYSDMANVFTSVAGNGRLMGNDLLRMSSRGVNAAATLGEAMNKTEAEVREMVTAGEIDFETFYKAMDNAFGEHATKASETYSGALSNVRAALGRLGAAVATPAHEALRRAFVAVTPVINSVGVALEPLIERWSELMDLAAGMSEKLFEGMDLGSMGGGILSLWTSFENILKAIYAILGPIGEAFFNLIPDSTGSMLMSLITGFEKFTESLILSEEASDFLRRALMDMSGFIKGLIERVVGLATSFTGTFPNMTSVIRAFSLGTATALSDMGAWLGEVLSNSAFNGLRRLGENIKSLTSIFNYHYSETASVFKSLYNVVKEYLKYLNVNFESFSEFVKSMATAVGNFLEPVWELVKDIFSGVDFRHFLGGGFLVGVWGLIKKIIENMDGLSGIWKGITDFIDVMKDKSKDSTSFLDSVAESLTGFSDALKEGVTLGRIVAIATAIGILAVAMKILEDLDTAQITRGMTAIVTSMTTLSLGMKALDGVDIGGVGGTKVIAFAAAIAILAGTMKTVGDLSPSQLVKGAAGLATTTAILATAMAVLDGTKVGTGPVTMIAIAGAIKILVSTLEDIDAVRVEGLVKGIGTIGLLLAGLATFANVMNGVKINMGTALSIAAIAGTMHILVDAIRKIDDIRVEGLIKGLGTIGILLAEIAVFGNVMKGVKIGPAMALGVLGIAQSMHIFADAIKKIDDIRVEGLIKGLGTIAVILGSIAAFSKVTKGTGMVSTAIGVGLIAGAISLLTPPLLELGEARWKDLVKGLGTMAGALAAMSIASRIATGTIGGAIAIAIMAKSLELLITPIERLSEMTWKELLSNLGKLALVIGAVAGASILLAPAVGPMLAFSATLATFGAAVALIGGGLTLFATGLVLLASLTATSVAAVITAIELLLDGVIGMLEKIGELISGVIKVIVKVIEDSAEGIVGAVMAIILAIITGIDENLPEFIERGTSIALSLMKGIQDNAEPLALAATDMVIVLIDAMTIAIDENGPRIIESVKGLIGQLLVFLVEVGTELIITLAGWIPGVEGKVTEMGEAMTEAIRETFGIDEEVNVEIKRAEGSLENLTPGMTGRSHDMGKKGADAFQEQYIIDQLGEEKGRELLKKIEAGEVPVKRAGMGLGKSGADGVSSVDWSPAGGNLVSGLQRGINSRSGRGGSLWNTAWNLGKTALSAIKSAIDSRSPSKETEKEGINFGMGLINGISSLTSRVGQTAGTMAREAVDTTNHFLDNLLSDMDREVHVKVVLDTSEFDSWNPEGFKPVRPDTSFTNRMVSESQPRSNQNEDTFNKNNDGNNESSEYNYDVHIHATGELPRATIKRMAFQFKDEIEIINRRDRMNRGEEVVY